MTTSASDFFERQEAARRATRRLVLWFSLGVAGTLIVIGFISRLFAQIIQAAISRHRERLAAAFFTR
ncbi:MAG TPA: hypothetical protein IAC75_04655 [Candidatus Spyradosoma merdigallinarum]|uniref:Uncharacterized protein n=1 Tax=Candidatus Spyradosoma merdigallinarum TaxID=2840950 RepID=A0A9D1NJU5_9BACT|nr:hypothetical protein [Candidatus Spyradosoma merdigallinarum]